MADAEPAKTEAAAPLTGAAAVFGAPPAGGAAPTFSLGNLSKALPDAAAPAGGAAAEVTSADIEKEVEIGHFAPVAKVEKQDTDDGETDESVEYKQRAKLFRYDKDVEGEMGWRERGVGDMRIMQHIETGKLRLLMRREKTHKICCNQPIMPATGGMYMLKENVGSDRSWMWSAMDLSDDREDGLTAQTLAIRFKDSDIATAFKDAYAKAQAAMETLVAAEEAAGGDDEDDL